MRLISRLDIKGPNLIKSVQLEGLRVIGEPNEFARKYYADGADELVFMDFVASLYGRNQLSDVIKAATEAVFIPITVGGGIRKLDDVKTLLQCGADKVAVNTGAVNRPDLLREISEEYGSQCLVLSIEAKSRPNGTWTVLTDGGREETGMKVADWIEQALSLGVGEILVTSVDREGTRKGFDIELVTMVNDLSHVPVIASGGMGRFEDLTDLTAKCDVSAIAVADMIHYNRSTMQEIRAFAATNDIYVRRHAEQ